MNRFIALALMLAAILSLAPAQARVLEPTPADARAGVRDCREVPPENQNPNLVGPYDIQICFDAFVVSFKSAPPKGEAWRIPAFVAHRIEPSNDNFAVGNPRPRGWYTVDTLYREGLAATHRSYRTDMNAAERASNDWYERGHLAAKNLIERVGPKAAEFTHNTVNAVPQRGRFNRVGWLDLECRTGAWANQADALWVVAGPLLAATPPNKTLRAPLDPTTNGTGAEKQNRQPVVAIPESLFKVVVRQDGGVYRALAFVFPQEDKSYSTPKSQQDPTKFLRSIALIEEQTGLVFFAGLPNAPQKAKPDARLWPLKKSDFDAGCKDFAKDS